MGRIKGKRTKYPVDKFMFACFCNKLQYVKNEVNSSPNLRKLLIQENFNALNISCSRGNIDIVEFLVNTLYLNEETKDVSLFSKLCIHQDKTGYTPLHSACSRKQIRVVKFLFETLYINKETRNIPLFSEMCTISNIHGYTPLYTLCNLKCIDIVKVFIDSLYVNKKTRDISLFSKLCTLQTTRCEESIMHILCEKGSVMIIKLFMNALLDNDISLLSKMCSLRNRDGQAPLHMACLYDRYEVIKLFVTKLTQQDIKERISLFSQICAHQNDHGKTIFYNMSIFGRLKQIKLMLNLNHPVIFIPKSIVHINFITWDSLNVEIMSYIHRVSKLRGSKKTYIQKINASRLLKCMRRRNGADIEDLMLRLMSVSTGHENSDEILEMLDYM